MVKIANQNYSKNIDAVLSNSGQVAFNLTDNFVVSKLKFDKVQTPNIKITNCNNFVVEFVKCLNPLKDYSGASYVGKNVCIHLENCTNGVIRLSYGFNFVNFVYAINCSNIDVLDCFGRACYRIMPRGQFVQFNKVDFGDIARNKFYNPRGFQNEDMINLFDTNDINVYQNDLKGENNYSTSGTAAIVDASSLFVPMRNKIYQNNIVNSGQVGIGLAGGNLNEAYENKIFGIQQTASNVGAYIGNFALCPSCDSNTLRDNQIFWTNAAGSLNNTFIDNTPPNNATNSIVSNNINTPSLANTLLSGEIVTEEIYNNAVYQKI